MLLFLLKGLFRDRSRSLIPLLTVIGGVSCTVILYSYITGMKNEMVRAHAGFIAGHVKIMSKAYAGEADQIPNDLAMMDISQLLDTLRSDHPEMTWVTRINFSGLLDIPDSSRETRIQCPVIGMAVDIISKESPEPAILNLKNALVRGRLPRQSGEIVISEDLANTLKFCKNATLISRTMYGSLSSINFTIVGTIHFGMSYIDSNLIIADFADIQYALDMENAAGEILGFFPDFIYQTDEADVITSVFNANHISEDEFAPVMFTFMHQNRHSETLEIVKYFSTIIIGIFIVIMSIVLLNAGLMGGIRRYGEIGIRLALGEYKGHLYRSLLAESLMTGFLGSSMGTALGVAFSYYLQVKGIDISSMTKNSSVMIVDVLRAEVTSVSYCIGFIPGFCATFLGTTFSGIGIYKRQTSQLSREFEE
ncbi:FtsX-like permease family protein [bacterium]|nr:FtsX-like permease family protein [bacterium]